MAHNIILVTPMRLKGMEKNDRSSSARSRQPDTMWFSQQDCEMSLHHVSMYLSMYNRLCTCVNYAKLQLEGIVLPPAPGSNNGLI